MKNKRTHELPIPENMKVMFLLFGALKPYFEKLSELEEKISEIDRKLDILLENISSETIDNGIVVVKEIKYEDAKRMVLDYFKEHGEADIEELHKNLKMDIETLIRILHELEDEGYIG
ncbi:MAG: hypothetical protein J7J42_06645 [Thermoplasmata archaeon]|nr:hypothetical protein [Thermoplasmata archaeon]